MSNSRAKIKVERKNLAISRHANNKVVRGRDTILEMTNPDRLNSFVPQDDAESQMNADISAVGAEIARNRAAYEQKAAIVFDEKFFFTLIFQTEEQKMNFINHFGLLDTLPYDNFGNMYLHGPKVSQILGFPIPLIDFPDIDIRGNPKKYRGLTLKKGGDDNE